MISSRPRKVLNAITDPRRAIQFIGAQANRKLANKEFVARQVDRSESEGGTYVAFVQRAARDYKVFQSFKRHPSYQEVLEHVSKQDGLRYLNLIESQSPQLLTLIESFKENDSLGNPVMHWYPSVGQMSPTTLRYIKVASDLQKLFGSDIGDSVVEIGVGYGGQLFINDKVFSMGEYHLYDLPPVLSLVEKYLESFILNCSYKLATLNQSIRTPSYDLVISNYAFSELPSQLQRMYIKKIISKCRKGYMTMNSGRADSVFNNNHLSLAELQELLPPFEILEECPLSSPNNYIIAWGQKL